MATFNWQGASNETYKYTIHESSWKPAADQDGNYIFLITLESKWHLV